MLAIAWLPICVVVAVVVVMAFVRVDYTLPSAASGSDWRTIRRWTYSRRWEDYAIIGRRSYTTWSVTNCVNWWSQLWQLICVLQVVHHWTAMWAAQTDAVRKNILPQLWPQCFTASPPYKQGPEKPGFFKSPTHWVLGFCWILGFVVFSDFFYLNEQLGSLLVDLAHQLSFCLDTSVL